MLQSLYGLLFILLSGKAINASKLNIIQIVADDLGYNDLAHANGNKTITPNIDALINAGVELKDYYTFKVCAPTRTSLMTGRYPWKTGYYDMINDGDHCVDPRFVMLPEILKRANYSTHAIGTPGIYSSFVSWHALGIFSPGDSRAL